MKHAPTRRIWTLTVGLAVLLGASVTVLQSQSDADEVTVAAAAASSATAQTETDDRAALTSRGIERQVDKVGTVTPGDVAHPTAEFTQDEEGLQAYLDALAQTYDVRIAVQQLDGDWAASVRADEVSVAASTYKMFVAIYTLNLVQDGTLTYDTVLGGQTVEACLTSMITVSDNDCAYVFLNNLGREAITQFYQDRGYTTSMVPSDGTIYTTAAELTRLQVELSTGAILDGTERDFLLELMGEQVYREGIPAGSAGQVADKVGFLWEYLNDTAIVHTDSGSYALTVISDGASWETIASITSNIEAIMYPDAA